MLQQEGVVTDHREKHYLPVPLWSWIVSRKTAGRGRMIVQGEQQTTQRR